MTFASDLVRLAYHQLPTDVQRYYLAVEDVLADRGRVMQIDGVVQADGQLEVLLRVTEPATI